MNSITNDVIKWYRGDNGNGIPWYTMVYHPIGWYQIPFRGIGGIRYSDNYAWNL